jgi:Asp-tRNA(Asn)/Glu-tRNA(Gln) amidotransferase A subunit family amidase
MSEAASRQSLNVLSATELSDRLGRGDATSVALVESCLARIEERDSTIRAWAYIDRNLALAQAHARDAEPRRSPLHGVPIGIKDIFDTYDMPTSHGSKAFAGNRPTADSGIVALMRRAGMVILGKCRTTEFATPIPADVKNPRDFGRSPGVSSSGSAASVADYMTPVSLGSQTGGSTILPASFCGVVGFKASLTGLDRGGIRHLRPSLDSMGLFARDLSDIALLYALLSGESATAPPRSVAGLRVGVCHTVNWSQAQPETVTAMAAATSALRGAGAALIHAEMPAVFNDIEQSFGTIATVEGARTMATDVEAHGAGMNHWLQEMRRTAPTIDLARYEKAQLHALACQRELADVFTRCDVIITPSAVGEATPDLTGVSNSSFNRIWTLMHGPCVSIPAFTGPNGLPVGIQVVGPVGSDARTIACAQSVGSVLL